MLPIIIPTLQLIIIRRQALIQIKTEGGEKEKKREAEGDDDGGGDDGDDVLHCCLPTPPVPRQIFPQDEEGEGVLYASEERKVHRFWVGESLGVGIRGKAPLLRAPEGREAGWQVGLLHKCKWRKALCEHSPTLW